MSNSTLTPTPTAFPKIPVELRAKSIAQEYQERLKKKAEEFYHICLREIREKRFPIMIEIDQFALEIVNMVIPTLEEAEYEVELGCDGEGNDIITIRNPFIK
jgi:hypothetical protein